MARNYLLDDIEPVLANAASQYDGGAVDELGVAGNVVDRQVALPKIQDEPQVGLCPCGEPCLREPDC